MMVNWSARLAGVVAVVAVAAALTSGAASAAAPGGPRVPGYLSVQGQFVGVTTVSAGDAWAVGDTTTRRDKPLLAHWDGRTWAKVRSSALPALGQLYGVARFPGGVFAVGFSGASDSVAQPLVLRLNGATARRVPAPDVRGGVLLSVTATSASNAWAVGQIFRGPALILHWNGQTWSRTRLSGFRVTALNGVAATSAASAWAIGNARQDSGPLILHWNGRRWSRAAFPAPAGGNLQLRDVTATSAVNAWAVGFSGGIANPAVTVALHWNGRKWERVPSPNPTGGSEGDGFLGVSASSARSAWAVGGGFEGLGGELMADHWNGTAWKVEPTPGESGNLKAVSALPAGSGWAVGESLASEAEGVQTLILAIQPK